MAWRHPNRKSYYLPVVPKLRSQDLIAKSRVNEGHSVLQIARRPLAEFNQFCHPVQRSVATVGARQCVFKAAPRQFRLSQVSVVVLPVAAQSEVWGHGGQSLLAIQ